MWHLYLDESGDLGFDFQDKHPTQYLTISILAISQPGVVKGISCAVKKTLRRKVNRRTKREQELKGTSSTIAVKRHFYEQIAACRFGIHALTLEKRNVREHLRNTPHAKSRLYNYIAKQVLSQIPFEMADGSVQLIVDKSKSGREIRDFNQYVQNHLEGRLNPTCRLDIFHRHSDADRTLSAADLFCWGIFRRHEQADEEWYSLFKEKVLYDERYFAS